MRTAGELIPQSFFERPAQVVAPELLGQHLVQGEVALRITEVEAYGGPEDSASHCRFGRTPLNAPMWEAGGVAYVFLCYGVHHMLNVVCGPQGQGAAVLIRAAEPVSGLPQIQSRRGQARGTTLLAGPGRVAQALGVSLEHSGQPLWLPGGLMLCHAEPVVGVLRGPRIGIPYATAEDQVRPWRFAVAGSPWVTQAKGLAVSQGRSSGGMNPLGP